MSSEVEARLDKMLADLARAREEAEAGEADIAQIQAEIAETTAAIREREAQIREMAGTVEERAAETREQTTQIRAKATMIRWTQEEVRETVTEIEAKRAAIEVPARDVLDVIGEGVTALERPFAQVSAGLRQKAEQIRETGRAKREPMPQPGEIVGLPGPGQRPRPGGVEELMGLGIRAGASAFDAFTMIARPVILGETVVTTAKLFVDAPTRKAFLRSAAMDPAGLGADILGGVVGGYALGYGIGRVRRAYTTRKYLLDVPDEAFLVPEEAAFSYPQPETLTKTTAHDYLRKIGETGVVDDFDGYRGPITFDKQIKGFRRTGAELLPELVPDQAPKVSIYKPGVTRMIETFETFRPAVRLPLRPDVMPRAPLALTTGLGILSSLKAPKEIEDPAKLAEDVIEESRMILRGTTRVRRRPKPQPPGFIEAPIIIERAPAEEKEKVWVAPMFRPPPQVTRRRQRQRPIMDVTLDVTQKEIERPPELLFSWPTTYRRPIDRGPVYRPRRAKEALKRGRGAWKWFGEYRQYLRGDPLKVLEGF